MTKMRSWTLDDVTHGLRSMRSAGGNPSYAEIVRRIAEQRAARGVPAGERRPARATVYDCFRTDRRRLDVDLVVEIAKALGAGDAEAARWAQACRVAHSQADAATVVTAFAELPTPIEQFVGRQAELDMIVRAGSDTSSSSVFSIEGMPGCGKSQLAIRAARRLLDAGHVDGVLHADLRGFHADNPPVDPAAVLGTFLRLLDVPVREIPDGLAQRQAAFQARMRARRHVIVLDDALNADQVAPLVPRDSGAVVLVTSRTTLGDPVEAVQVPLGVFARDEAVGLLRDVAGADVVDADLAAATELVEASGCLPLAVRLTATRVAARPGWSLADHVEPLLRRRRGLRLDDAVGATLDVSYAALSSAAQATLRLLGAHPCADLDVPAIAALVDSDVDQARRSVDELTTHHLVSRPRPHRYSLHALVQTYALDRSYDEDRQAVRDEAWGRLCDHHLAMVWAGYNVTYRAMSFINRQAPAHVGVPDLDEISALAWLDANIENVLTLASQGAELGRPDLANHLSDGISWWVNRYGRYREARMLHSLALDNAGLRGNQVGAARARLDLGQILVRLAEWDAATIYLTQAERAFEDMGDLYAACSGLNALAIVDVHHGRLSEGIERFRRAAELAGAAGHDQGTATAWDNIAVVHRRAGRLDEALEFHRRALELAERIGDRYLQATGLTNVSEVQLLLGSHDDALSSAQRGLVMAHELDNAPTIAYGNDNVANVLSARGDHEEALGHYREALVRSREIGDRHLEAGVLNSLGVNYLNMGDATQARRHLDDALKVSTAVGDLFERARGLNGIGSVLAAGGDDEGARRTWDEALELFERLGSPEATEVRDHLARLPGSAQP
jgi:tetratricopeptide (TPR) repeat protein